MSVTYELTKFTVRSRIGGDVQEGVEVLIYADVAGAKGTLSTGVFDIDGVAVDQTTDPLVTDTEGAVMFRHTPGTWFIEGTKDADVYQRPGYQIGNAGARNAGIEAGELPPVPDPTGNEGRFLALNDAGTEAEWKVPVIYEAGDDAPALTTILWVDTDEEPTTDEINVDKAASGDDALIRFRTALSARAEMGLLANDDLTVRVSPDGSTFLDALVIDKDTGEVTQPQNVETLTPTITALTVGDLSVAYTTQVLTIRKFDGLVAWACRITFTPTFTTAAGQFRIVGFPFNFVGGAGSITFGGSGGKPSFPAGCTGLAVRCAAGQSWLVLTAYGTGAAQALEMSNFVSGTQYIIDAAGMASI